MSSDEADCFFDAEEIIDSEEDDAQPQPINNTKLLNTRKCTSRKHSGESCVGGVRCQMKVLKKKRRKATRPKQPPVITMPHVGEKLAVEIIFAQTLVDVVWQVL